MRTVDGAVVLITGAARGMGRLYAQLAVAEGARAVVLWDADADLLAQVATELGPTAHPHVVDLSDSTAIQSAATETIARFGAPAVLINNAGIVRGKPFVEHEHDADIALTMQVNALAPMHVTRAFLPAMLGMPGERRIVNIASAAGLVPTPRMSVYSASKWAVVGWSDSLRLELRGTGIAVTTVCPSFITTGMFAGARGPRLTPLMDPADVTARVWRAMKRGTPFLLLPAMVKVSRVLRGVLPTRAFDWLAGDIFRVYSSMDQYTGRR